MWMRLRRQLWRRPTSHFARPRSCSKSILRPVPHLDQGREGLTIYIKFVCLCLYGLRRVSTTLDEQLGGSHVKHARCVHGEPQPEVRRTQLSALRYVSSYTSSRRDRMWRVRTRLRDVAALRATRARGRRGWDRKERLVRKHFMWDRSIP